MPRYYHGILMATTGKLKMSLAKPVFFSTLIGFSLISCGGGNNSAIIDGENNNGGGSNNVPPFAALIQSDAPKETAPDIADADAVAAADDALQFAFTLYQQLSESENDNMVFAPYSISSALSMLYAGAAGITASEMASALNFNLPKDRLFPSFNAVDISLNSQSSENAEIQIVNSVWGANDRAWKSGFLDILAKNYGAGLNAVDFASDPESIRTGINDWVAQTTNNRITNLLPAGSVNTETILLLTNAIYLNANWLVPFDPDDTNNSEFELISGDSITTPTMTLLSEFAHSRESYFDVIELPYDGNNLSMVILIPDSGTFGMLESDLSASLINTSLANLQNKNVSLFMPKFELTSSLALSDTLKQLGMTSAFSFGDADFTAMSDAPNIAVENVLHKSFIKVDEKGTEAAAATGVVVGVTSVPAIELELAVDSPFVFLIRDLKTKSTLFIGRVLDPR